jgi:hypothetical protein
MMVAKGKMAEGRIKLHRGMLAGAALAVPLLLFVGVMAVREGSVIVGGLLLLGTLISAVGIVPGFSAALDLVWTETGVAGPCRVWGPFFGFARAQMDWLAIRRVDGTAAGYGFMEDAAGVRIY